MLGHSPGKISWLSDGAHQVLGRSSDDLTRENIQKLMSKSVAAIHSQLFQAHVQGAPSTKVFGISDTAHLREDGFLDSKDICIKPFPCPQTSQIVYFAYLEKQMKEGSKVAWTDDLGFLEGFSTEMARLVGVSNPRKLAGASLFQFFPGLMDLFFLKSKKFRNRFEPLEDLAPAFPLQDAPDGQGFFASALVKRISRSPNSPIRQAIDQLLHSHKKLDYLSFRDHACSPTDTDASTIVIHVRVRIKKSAEDFSFFAIEVLKMESSAGTVMRLQSFFTRQSTAKSRTLLGDNSSEALGSPQRHHGAPTRRSNLGPRSPSMAKNGAVFPSNALMSLRHLGTHEAHHGLPVLGEGSPAGRDHQSLNSRSPDEDQSDHSVSGQHQGSKEAALPSSEKDCNDPKVAKEVHYPTNWSRFAAHNPLHSHVPDAQLASPPILTISVGALDHGSLLAGGDLKSTPVIKPAHLKKLERNKGIKEEAQVKASLHSINPTSAAEKDDNHFQTVKNRLRVQQHHRGTQFIIPTIFCAYICSLGAIGYALFDQWFIDFPWMNSKGFFFVNLIDACLQQVIMSRVLSLAPTDTIAQGLFNQSEVINPTLVSISQEMFQGDIDPHQTVFTYVMTNFPILQSFNLMQSTTADRIKFNGLAEFVPTLNITSFLSHANALTFPTLPPIPYQPNFNWYLLLTLGFLLLLFGRVVYKYRSGK